MWDLTSLPVTMFDVKLVILSVTLITNITHVQCSKVTSHYVAGDLLRHPPLSPSPPSLLLANHRRHGLIFVFTFHIHMNFIFVYVHLEGLLLLLLPGHHHHHPRPGVLLRGGRRLFGEPSQDWQPGSLSFCIGTSTLNTKI